MNDKRIVELSIKDIKVRRRQRKDYGDIEALGENIKEIGLLQPIGVTPDNRLVFGERRLRAYRLLGRDRIPARIVDLANIMLGEFSENVFRKEYSVSERVAIVEAMRSFKHGGDRRSKQIRNCDDETLTIDDAAKRAGLGGKDGYFRAKSVVDNGVPELVEAMDSGRLSISAAATLAEAAPEEQIECLTKRLDEKRWTAKGIERQLRRIRIGHAELEQSALPDRSPRTKHSKTEIWCGDCLSLMADRMKPKSVDVAVTSPPYNIAVAYSAYDDNRPEDEYFAWLSGVFEIIKRVLKDNGSFFLNVASTRLKPWTAMRVAEIAARFFVLQNEIIWVKSITVDGGSHGHLTPLASNRFLNHNFEHIFHFTKNGKVGLDRLAIGVPYEDPNNLYRNKANRNLRCGGDVWFVPHQTTKDRTDKGCHPCVFPAELPERCIKLHGITDRMLVLDPFCGTGSSLIAAQRLDVKGIGIDLDPAYCNAAQKRLAEFADSDKAVAVNRIRSVRRKRQHSRPRSWDVIITASRSLATTARPPEDGWLRLLGAEACRMLANCGAGWSFGPYCCMPPTPTRRMFSGAAQALAVICGTCRPTQWPFWPALHVANVAFWLDRRY